MEPCDPYRLIADTARRARRRQRLEVVLLALPPAATAIAALALGSLPLELGAAGAIALGIVLLHVASLDVPSARAASFLDRSFGAKEHFLTLATVERPSALRASVEAGAAAIARAAQVPSFPPRRRRPLVASIALSLAGFALLWMIPELASIAWTGGGLDRLTAELAASPDAADREIAHALREVARALDDPRLSAEEKQAKIEQAIAEIDAAERRQQQAGGGGSSAGEGGKGKQEQQKSSGESQGKEPGQSSSAQQKGPSGEGAGSSGARGQARQELSKLAGEISGEAASQAKSQPKEGKKPEPAGGGIQGPESGAKERKPSEQDASGNQSGQSPDQSGGNQQPGKNAGEAKPPQGSEPQPNPAGAGKGLGSGEGGPGQRSAQGPDQPAERYYKPGEGPGGRIVDGRYVRIRVPEDRHPLDGSEPVAKPGEVAPEVGYGNAPPPSVGSPGEVSADQPVPLEYRAALGATQR